MAFEDPGKGRSVIVGPGPEAATVTLAEACSEGDVLGYSSGWKKALAAVTAVIQGRLVALKGGAVGDVIPVAAHCVVRGYTGATPGGYVYVAEGSDNGKVTQTAPSTTNDANTIIGIALSATDIQFFLNSRADSLSS
ncbi:MAG: hypothetical protein PHO26_10605 [Dehalococcoidia bacterium]|nr:hypothetical protein [Dehalococcoidia bacterium]